jgi:hypothetical protein
LRLPVDFIKFTVKIKTGGPLSTSLSEILKPFSAERITEWYTDLTDLWHTAAPVIADDHLSPKSMTQWIHYNNFVLWHLEDDARRNDIPAEEIVKVKRGIDSHNQNRSDVIEKIDIWLANVLQTSGIETGDDVEMNSETPGSIIDRLSILTLKMFHMEEQVERDNISKEHEEVSKKRLEILNAQRYDLGNALDKLILDLRSASKKHKVYRQFKMYNDPEFNPALYQNNSTN